MCLFTLVGRNFWPLPRTPPPLVPRDLHFSVKLNLGSDGIRKETFFSAVDFKLMPQ